MKRYEELAAHVAALVANGTLREGDRLPSVRDLRRERGVSVATVTHAYQLLEARGLVETRPQSGRYVSERAARKRAPTRSAPRPTRVDVSELVFEILDAARDRRVVPLGSAFPSPLLFPWRTLARHLGRAARQMNPWSTVESLPPGSLELRRQLARRYLRFGARVLPDEIVITNGAMEALNLSLEAVTKPGDAVAIESPSFYACLQAIEQLGLKAVEIPTDAREGVALGALERALDTHKVRACWLMTSFQNPLGATMPDDKKRDLVRLLERRGVPLIEDDVYAELYFGTRRPRAAKSFDSQGLVLHCGSFSKCLAPGYRLGWVAAGRFARDVQRRKVMTSLATSIPVQDAIAGLLRHESYDAHLKKLRRALASQQKSLLDAVRKYFPAGCRVTKPDGGYFVWLELPEGADSLELHRLALERGISIAPGPIFSPKREYRRCVRLNCGHPWSTELDRTVRTLARLAAGAS
ncbi:MAG TPA: PLP-dependent aminotransferase family protein [Gammaproteobacteria bacterium]|nr:PLP-dependent aminotransferase family protein [Gammaproteobacteria bacterium]